jgi:hypothetical protein
MKMSKAKSGGGYSSNKRREVGVRTGPPRTNKISVQAVSELGPQPAFKGPPLIKGTAPQVRSGNDLAESCPQGPGGGRKIYERGTEGMHGKPSWGEAKGGNTGKDILSEFGKERSRG